MGSSLDVGSDIWTTAVYGTRIFNLASKWRCGPVVLPVVPTLPITSPVTTVGQQKRRFYSYENKFVFLLHDR